MKRLFPTKILVLMALLVCSISAMAQEAYAVFTDDNETLTFYYDNLKSTRQGTVYNLNIGYDYPDWYNDGTNASLLFVEFDPSFADARPTTTCSWFLSMNNLTTIIGMEYLNTSEVTNMSNMFNGCYVVTDLDISHFNTKKVTDMSGMFSDCWSVPSLDLSSFNTNNVTNMREMFVGYSSPTNLDLSNFNTANVTDMSRMFASCYLVTTLDVSNFNTEKVTDMSGMFEFCDGLTSLDLSSFNTENVTNMREMFLMCLHLPSLDLSNFNTENVTNISLMFEDCPNMITIDLSNFKTSSVEYMDYMFTGCTQLTTIFAGSDWDTTAVINSNNMFMSCSCLMGGEGTTFDSRHTDATYAHIDGGPSNPGYFTKREVIPEPGDLDGDGIVSISDITALVDYILNGDSTGIYTEAADVDGDGKVSVSDVTTLIDYLLQGYWP